MLLGLRLILVLVLTSAAMIAHPAGAQDVASGAPVPSFVRTSGLGRPANTDFRVLSWNVAGQEIFLHAEELRAVLHWVDPDVLLLDEMTGDSEAALREVLHGLRSDADTVWHVLIGGGGGYQRGSVASRERVEALPEFHRIPYPDSALARLRLGMSTEAWNRTKPNLEAGLAVAGAVVHVANRMLLAVSMDLQCCGTAADWREDRRRIEAREIRRVLGEVLAELPVDGVLLAGDLNLVGGPEPLVILGEPYQKPHEVLVPVEAVQLDGEEQWTWDGRGSPFPSATLDFVLHTPSTLQAVRATVLSTEDIPEAVLDALDLDESTTRALSDHLPIVTDWRWRDE